MSRLMLHDSGDGGKIGWATEAIRDGLACGFVLSPFETPPVDAIRRRHAWLCAYDIASEGGEVFFDPTTHAAADPSTDKLTIYDEWGLWRGGRGNVAAVRSRREHVKLAIEAARRAGARPIAPTVTLSRPVGSDADAVLDMAAVARATDTDAVLAVAGTSEFWAAERELDDFVGELVDMSPAGFSLTVVRSTPEYPPAASSTEVYGICRSVHAMSHRGADVLALHGDLAGLPAVAAGTTRIGSGWHARARVFSVASYRLGAKGRQVPRPTYAGLLAALKRGEAATFEAVDTPNSHRLYPGRLPPEADRAAHWRHHLEVLNEIVDHLVRLEVRQDRARHLRSLYDAADTGFGLVAEALDGHDPLAAGSSRWVEPLRGGLHSWMDDEGYA